MDMPDFANLTQQEKIKLGTAAGLLVVALFLIYWFGLRSPRPSGEDLVAPQSSDASQSSQDPAEAPRTRLGPVYPGNTRPKGQ